MSKIQDRILDNLFVECEKDFVKLFNRIAKYLKENTDFYTHDNYNTILNETFSKYTRLQMSCPILPLAIKDGNQNVLDLKNASHPNDEPQGSGKSLTIITPFDSHMHDSNEASNDMFGDDSMDSKDDDALVIDESLKSAEKTAEEKEIQKGQERNADDSSSNESNITIDQSYIPETQCENGEGDDDSMEYIKIRADTNSCSAAIDQSQNIMEGYSYGLILEIDTTKNNKSHDSINLSTSLVNKLDDPDLEMSALKWNESDKSALLQKSQNKAGNATSSTPNNDRCFSITPDLDEFIIGEAKYNGNEKGNANTSGDGRTSSTPEFLSAKSTASSKTDENNYESPAHESISNEQIETHVEHANKKNAEPAENSGSDKTVGEKSESKINAENKDIPEPSTSKYHNLVPIENEVGDNTAEAAQPTVDVTKSTDNQENEVDDFYAQATQAPPILDAGNSTDNQVLVSAENEVDDFYAQATQAPPTVDAGKSTANQDLVSAENEVDDIYAQATQAPPEIEVASKEPNNLMPPPASRKKFNFKQRLTAPSPNTIYELATQEFTPPENRPKELDKEHVEQVKEKDVPETSNNGQNDDFYEIPTQILPEAQETSSQKSKKFHRFTPTSEIDDTQLPETPEFSVVKNITNEMIAETNDKWKRKAKKLKKKNEWLFSSDSEDGELDSKKKRMEVEPQAKKIEKRRGRSKRLHDDEPMKTEIEPKRSRSSGQEPILAPPSKDKLKKKATVVLSPLSLKSVQIDNVKTKSNSVAVKHTSENGTQDKIIETKKAKVKDLKEEPEIERTGRITRRKASIDSMIKKADTAKTETVNKKLHDNQSKSVTERPSRAPVRVKEEPLTPKSRNTTRSTSNHSTDSSSSRRSTRVTSVTSPYKGKYQVLFTKCEQSLEMLDNYVRKLGGDVVSNAIYSTVLVAPQFGRTCKMLSAFAKGIPIVSTKWVTDSYKARKFLDPENYLINVSEAEKRFKFKLKKSLERARAAGVFKGFSFYVTPNTKPSPQELSEIIKCAGGNCYQKHTDRARDSDKVYLVSCPEDEKFCLKYKTFHKDIPVLDTEAIMTSVLQQTISFAGNYSKKK